MRFQASIVAAALACAGPLAAQAALPRGPQLLRVVASSGGVVLSVDSTTVARTGDSTFVADAIYDFPADSTQQVGADRQVESQEMDCAGMRLRGRHTAYYLGDSPLPVSTRDSVPPSPRWEPVGDDELPIVQVLCQFLLGSFAAQLPVTREAWSVDQPPELANARDVGYTLAAQYPRAAVRAGATGQVMLRFLINDVGRVEMESVRTLWATRDDFAEAAVRVLPAMRFRPAKHDGEPVAVWATTPISFFLEDDGPGNPSAPQRGPSGSPLWGGRSPRPTQPVHPDPYPGIPL